MIIKRTRIALAAVLVTLACAGIAHAETLTFSPVPAENIELASEGALTFAGAGEAFRVSCQVTLSGTMLETSFTMTEGTQFGSINRSRTETCSGGSLTFLRLAEAPDRLTYRSFLGVLPNITGIRYRIGEVALQAAGGLTCLYTGDVEALMELREVDAWFVEPGAIASGTLRLSSGALCPETATLSGRLALQNMQVANRPIMQWTPAGINFGSIRVGTSEGRTSRFENIAGALIEITEVRTRGTGCASFRFTNGGGALAAGRTLAAGGRIEITATFEPTSLGIKVCDYEVRARVGAGAVRQRSLIVWGRGI